MSNVFEENPELVRNRLREVVQLEKEKFLTLAEAFYKSHGRRDAQCLELTRAIIATVDAVMAAGHWKHSPFLRDTVKPLLDLQQQAQAMQTQLLRDQGEEAPEAYVLKGDEVKVYISLYQAEGHDMKQWELQLRSIDSYMMGRPIYKNEEEVRNLVRQKVVQTSEAYAVAVVPSSRLLANEFSAKKVDRRGCELLVVEALALKPSDVIEFVHLNKRYHFYKQTLVAQR